MPESVETPSVENTLSPQRPDAGKTQLADTHAALLAAISDLAGPIDTPQITAADVDGLRLALNGGTPPRPLPARAFATMVGSDHPPVNRPRVQHALEAPQQAAEEKPRPVLVQPEEIGQPPPESSLQPPRPLVLGMFLQPDRTPDRQAPTPPPAMRTADTLSPARTFARPSIAATRAPAPRSSPAQRATAEARVIPSSPAELDPLFSEIDSEASARSLIAIAAATSDAVVTPPPLQPPLPLRMTLPRPAPESPPEQAPAAGPRTNPIADLGREIPSMPRFAAPPSATAMPTLAVDLSVRPDRVETKIKRPATGTAHPGILRRLLRIALLLVIGWLAIVLMLIVVFRFVDPPGSSLMLQQWLTGEKITQRWVPIEAMSPQIVRAVIASEDARFCSHNGIDFDALREAVEDVGTSRARGASTISMQVTKNLFLWPSKSYLRKLLEIPLTVVLEATWPKRRIMEVYLNIAEWGPGIFGIQAASRYHFGRSAGRLSAGDASRLAAALPNPLVRNPARPGPGMKRLARALQVRARLAPASRIACVQPLRGL